MNRERMRFAARGQETDAPDLDAMDARIYESMHGRAGLDALAKSARQLGLSALAWQIEKARKKLVESGTAEILAKYAASLPEGVFDDPAKLEAHARAFAESAGLGFGKLVHPVRAAVTGRTEGPPLFDCFCIVGRTSVHARLLSAANLAGGAAAKS